MMSILEYIVKMIVVTFTILIVGIHFTRKTLYMVLIWQTLANFGWLLVDGHTF